MEKIDSPPVKNCLVFEDSYNGVRAIHFLFQFTKFNQICWVTDNDLQSIIFDAINNIDDVLSSLEFFKPGIWLANFQRLKILICFNSRQCFNERNLLKVLIIKSYHNSVHLQTRIWTRKCKTRHWCFNVYYSNKTLKSFLINIAGSYIS